MDEQQINLDRFNLYFPEKRPFFLENAGAFTVSNAGGAVQGDPAQTELFFSRGIGIEQGRVVPIVAGARLSGKVSNSVTVGFLNMQTEAVDGLTPANNFTVARVRRDLPNRSSIGGLLVNRQATGRLAAGDNYNRTYAFDGRMGLGQNGDIQGFVGRTETPGREGRDHAYNVGANYESQTWRFQGGVMESGEDFNPEVGFTRRVGFRKVDGGIFYTWRPENFLKSFELRPHVTYNRFWDFNGFMETSLLHMDNRWEFEDSSTLVTAWNVRGEGVKESFEVSGIPVPIGEYEWSEGNIWFNYNRSAPVNAGVRLVFGGFFGGDILSVRSSLNARYAETLNFSLIWDPQRHRPAGRQCGDEPARHACRLQLLAPAVRAEPGAVQRQPATVVGELSFRLAAGRQHRAVSRLQRDRGHQRVHPSGRRPEPDSEIQLPVRPAGLRGRVKDVDGWPAQHRTALRYI